MQIRQGDVFLQKVDSLPKEAIEKDNILAYGESTGHKHQIVNGKVMVDNLGNQYVVANQETQLVHEEHGTITLTDNVFKVIQQREYDLSEGVRQVLD